MKAKHTNYTYVPRGHCKCYDSQWIVSSSEDTRLTAIYESTKVQLLCSACNESVSTFYREPSLESQSTKADKSLIDQTIQVNRFVSWVGYAKSTNTVFWSDKDEQAKVVSILAREVDISIEKAATVLASRTLWYDWLEVAIRKRARYELFGNAFKSGSFSDRGLWFMDKSLTVKIQDVLRVVTGKRDNGGYCYEWDGPEPPFLYNQVHHQLYCGNWQGQNVLIYPGDVVKAKK